MRHLSCEIGGLGRVGEGQCFCFCLVFFLRGMCSDGLSLVEGVWQRTIEGKIYVDIQGPNGTRCELESGNEASQFSRLWRGNITMEGHPAVSSFSLHVNVTDVGRAGRAEGQWSRRGRVRVSVATGMPRGGAVGRCRKRKEDFLTVSFSISLVPSRGNGEGWYCLVFAYLSCAPGFMCWY